MNNSANYTAALGRLLLAGIFLASGFQKVLTPEQTQAYIVSSSIPQAMAVYAYWTAVTVELLGGLCLVLGFATGLAALILAAFTIAAAIAFHNNFGDQNQLIHFMKNLAIAGGLLQVTAFGSGGVAVGHWWQRR